MLLQAIEEQAQRFGPTAGLQATGVLGHAADKIGGARPLTKDEERALLTAFHDLFRNGQLSWGHNLANPGPPFLHLTEQGRRSLQHLSRDPMNPDGYLAH